MISALKKFQKSKIRSSLTLIQSEIVRKIDQFEIDGTYRLVNVSCPLCENLKFKTIGETDRYGTNTTTVQCEFCGLLLTNPQFREQDYHHFYKHLYRELYDAEIKIEEAWNEQYSRGKLLVNFVKSKLNLRGLKILEVGCGTGGIIKAFEEAGAQVTGCDFGEKYIQFGKSKQLNLLVGSIRDFPTDSADVIVYSHVLEHIKNLEQEFLEIRRVLRPSGFLIIEVPGLFAIWRTYGGKVRDYFQNAHL